MPSSAYFRPGPEGKTVLTDDATALVKDRMKQIPPDQFGKFGASRSAFYFWIRGKPISSRGCQAIISLLEQSDEESKGSLDSWSIEDLVAALKRKGVKDVQIRM